MIKTNHILTKLHANSLQYTLIVGVVIFVLIFTVLWYFHLNQLISFDTDDKINQITEHQKVFYKAGNDAPITNEPWGAFYKSTSTAKEDRTNSPFTQVALTAPRWYQGDLPQIYLSPTSGYLQLSGLTTINGTAIVPYGQIKTTSAAGRIYEGTSITSINIKESLKQIYKHPMAQRSLNEWKISLKDSTMNILPNRLKRSFKKSQVSYYSKNPVELLDHQIIGNVRIISDLKITVYKDALIKDALLIAPEVELKSRTTLTAHIIANQKITLEENVSMKFPSSLTLTSDYNEHGIIELKENTSIKGVVHQFQKPKEQYVRPHLIIEKNVTINGLVYNLGFTSLKGTIVGSIFSHEFIAMERGNLFRNYIIDGHIQNPPWDKEYLSLFNKDSNHYRPLLWLY